MNIVMNPIGFHKYIFYLLIHYRYKKLFYADFRRIVFK